MSRPVLLPMLAVLIPATACAGSGQSALTVPNRPLPSSAVISKRVDIPGIKGAQAIAYRTPTPYLGVLESRKLIWKQKLTALPHRLVAPGPAHLFAAWVPSGSSATFYAFAVTGSHVVSAIDGDQSGARTANEGGSFSRSSVVLKNPDTSHTGSVKYRLIDRYGTCGRTYCLKQSNRVPDYALAAYPRPNGIIHNARGDTILLRLEIANTEAERELGLMYRKSLDPDSGMVFVWDSPTTESFWMQNTYVALTVAFVGPDGTILEMQDMQPLTTDAHQPHESYQYAIEVNQGYFASYGIKVGDKVAFNLSTS